VSLAESPPMYQLYFWDGEEDAKEGCLVLKLLERVLESADIATPGEGCDSDGEVIYLRDHQTKGDPEV